MKDLMLDLETFGKGNNAVIVQFGACYFDRGTGEIGDFLKINIDVETSLREGFEVDGSTLYWWLQQSEEARTSILTKPRIPVRDAIIEANNFMSKAEAIWSHVTFDYVKIMNHLERLDIKQSFHYRAPRDLRMLVDLADMSSELSKRVRTGTFHDALDDCFFQVDYTVECLKRIKVNNK